MTSLLYLFFHFSIQQSRETTSPLTPHHKGQIIRTAVLAFTKPHDKTRINFILPERNSACRRIGLPSLRSRLLDLAECTCDLSACPCLVLCYCLFFLMTTYSRCGFEGVLTISYFQFFFPPSGLSIIKWCRVGSKQWMEGTVDRCGGRRRSLT